MKKTKDMSIKKRLMNSFVFVILITSIAATIGIFGMWGVYVQSNSAAAEVTSATSEELSSQAEVLKSLVANFQLKN